MNDIAIKVEGLSKAYRLGSKDERPETLVQAAINLLKAPVRNFRHLRQLDTFTTERDTDDILWALKDISFDIKHGEVVGFIGRNGAGKSTLLKILSRITEPTAGRVEIRGRVSSLLEVGTGFHPELTGRENVYMNGTILGMKKAEINRQFDKIVDFSGVERFLDTPVKRYSSGMKVRLAFSVAAHLEPEVLIVDEVLAVGDAEFQQKSLGKMQDVAGSGRTVLFVSHNMAAIRSLCTRGIILRNGNLVFDSEAESTVNEYLKLCASAARVPLAKRNRNNAGKAAFITDVRLRVGDAEGVVMALCGHPIDIVIGYQARECSQRLQSIVVIFDRRGERIAALSTSCVETPRVIFPKEGLIVFHLPKLSLTAGSYTISVSIWNEHGRLDYVTEALEFIVEQGDFYGSGKLPPGPAAMFLPEYRWNIVPVGSEVKA